MGPKRPRSSSASFEPKKRRKMLTVNEKVALLDMIKSGRSYSEVGRHYGLAESTVRYIKKDELNIRKTAAISFSKEVKRVATPRNKNIMKMEKKLSVWIAECREKKLSLTTHMIQAKAKQLYDNLASEGEAAEGDMHEELDDEPQPSISTTCDPMPRARRFAASKGWFEKFKKRFGLQSVPNEEVNTLIECHSKPLEDNSLVKMARSASEEKEAQANEGDDGGLTLSNLQDLFNMAKALQQKAQIIDDNTVRALEFTKRIDGVMALYKDIFTQKKQRSNWPLAASLAALKHPVPP